MGDALFAVLCAGGHNIRKILAHLGALFEWIIAAIVLALCAPFRAAGHVSLRDIDPA
jgi:transposase, IS5 family